VFLSTRSITDDWAFPKSFGAQALLAKRVGFKGFNDPRLKITGKTVVEEKVVLTNDFHVDLKEVCFGSTYKFACDQEPSKNPNIKYMKNLRTNVRLISNTCLSSNTKLQIADMYVPTTKMPTESENTFKFSVVNGNVNANLRGSLNTFQHTVIAKFFGVSKKS
jgi:hypothetical protein